MPTENEPSVSEILAARLLEFDPETIRAAFEKLAKEGPVKRCRDEEES